MVKCEICNKQFKAITVPHLRKHGIESMKDYRTKYPNAEIIHKDRDACVNKLEFWIRKYGESDGTYRYTEYKKKMGYSNTFEYKREKYGWTIEQFNEYNKSRAVTKENLIKKYGEDDGLNKFEQYREKQKYAGCKLDYFISKYGIDKGAQIYKEVNLKKAQTLENYIIRYGNVLGKEKYLTYMNSRNNSHAFSSNNEMSFCDSIISALKEYDITYSKVYYYKTKQFGQWCHKNDTVCFYDLVIPSKKICIEYNGDYWHCNPNIYTPEFEHPHLNMKAAEIWERDKNKLETIKDMGYHVITVWESQYFKHKEKTINEIIACMNNINL